MYHCHPSLQQLLKQQQLNDSARLWDHCARTLHFSPSLGLAEKKTGQLVLGDQAYRVHISQNNLRRGGWLWQSQPRLRQLYQNHLLCEARQISTSEVVCYTEEKSPTTNDWRALLLIRVPAQAQGAQALEKYWPGKNLEQRQPLLQALASQLVQLHNCRLSHHNLHPVNLLVDPDSQRTWLDHLDHLSFQWRSSVASVQDLACFMAGMTFFDAADTEFFLQQYWRACKLGLTYQGLRTRVLAQVSGS